MVTMTGQPEQDNNNRDGNRDHDEMGRDAGMTHRHLARPPLLKSYSVEVSC